MVMVVVVVGSSAVTGGCCCFLLLRLLLDVSIDLVVIVLATADRSWHRRGPWRSFVMVCHLPPACGARHPFFSRGVGWDGCRGSDQPGILWTFSVQRCPFTHVCSLYLWTEDGLVGVRPGAGPLGPFLLALVSHFLCPTSYYFWQPFPRTFSGVTCVLQSGSHGRPQAIFFFKWFDQFLLVS